MWGYLAVFAVFLIVFNKSKTAILGEKGRFKIGDFSLKKILS
jgi:hypothetical protein